VVGVNVGVDRAVHSIVVNIWAVGFIFCGVGGIITWVSAGVDVIVVAKVDCAVTVFARDASCVCVERLGYQ